MPSAPPIKDALSDAEVIERVNAIQAEAQQRATEFREIVEREAARLNCGMSARGHFEGDKIAVEILFFARNKNKND